MHKEPRNYDYLVKTIILGSTGVGKSSLLQKFIYNTYTATYDITVGVEFGSKVIQTMSDKGEPTLVKLQIWDTAGHEKYRAITRSYYRGSSVVLIVYDISNRDSYNQVHMWLDDIKRYITTDTHSPIIVLLGNKADLEHRRCVTTEEGEALAKRYGMIFCEASAKAGTNVNSIFIETAEKACEFLALEPGTNKQLIMGVEADDDKSKCC